MSFREICYQGPPGVRVDKFLAESLGLSRSYWQRLLRQGFCLVNGRAVSPDYRLHTGTIVLLKEEIKEDVSSTGPCSGEVPIIYQDQAIIVASKPAGLLTHPFPSSEKDSLVGRVLARFTLTRIGQPWRPGVVHRLDRETSGVLVLARTDEAYWSLVNQFKHHQVEKNYLAVVKGRFPAEKKTVELGVGARRGQPTRMQVRFLSGKIAVTRFNLLEQLPDASLVEVIPITGRTHQIRVTLSYCGFPVLGDRKYGVESSYISRTALHAYRLAFIHPVTGQKMEFSAPLPEDLVTLLKILREEGPRPSGVQTPQT
ncbi:MAG TPA: RluA family pseudouridine synthase [bacterium]|nr:RluA family pseudouridine synthase [bacterium]HPP12939.1 RluA family pseudouridine synthase [bacterium]